MYQFILQSDNKVYSAATGDLQPGAIEVSKEAYEAFLSKPFDKDAYYIDGNVVLRDKQYSDNELAAAARSKRNILLAECDWTQLPDAPVPNKQAWADYRQKLRDITSQPGFPRDIIWPEKP